MIDVVVVNYQTPRDLTDFCSSFSRHHFPGCTLTVVDIEPPRKGEAVAPVDRWVNVGANIGYGAACNIGADGGTNPVILLANADTFITEGSLERCFSALISNDEWAVLGPRQVNEHGQITAGGIFGHPRNPAQRAWMQYDAGQVSDVRDDALTVSGSLYFIKRKVWRELTHCSVMQEYQPGSTGAFLHTPHYFEETACSYHARAHGYKCVYYGPVQMIHFWHRASPHGGWADQQFILSQKMHRDFCALHGIECE